MVRRKNVINDEFNELPIYEMPNKLVRLTMLFLILSVSFSSCILLQKNSKNNFNDGIYLTKRFSGNKVYIMKIDDDTISVFPVLEFKDSTAILTKKRVNFTISQKKFKDNLTVHTYYKPSFDLDIITLAMKFRPAENGIPNQLTTNFNGAVFCGYRIDAYKLKYKRTPLNNYKQNISHLGYSGGLYAGIGSTSINGNAIADPNSSVLYDGVVLTGGIALNIAVERIAFGLSLGADYLMDQYRNRWIYEGKPTAGFTIGLNLK